MFNEGINDQAARELVSSRTSGSHLDRELKYHMDHRVNDLVHSGLLEPEARRQATLEIGWLLQFGLFLLISCNHLSVKRFLYSKRLWRCVRGNTP